MDLRPSPAPDGGSERRVLGAAVLLFVAVALLTPIDLVGDLGEGTTFGHVAIEGGVVLVGVAGLVLGLRRMLALRRRERAARAEVSELGRRVAVAREEAERWRREAKDLLDGLGAAIERQLVHWQLSEAERDVARLLLKGLSHKEVAELRQVGEATVRQQARAVYRKAGVDGRHDLAAFFLEGLLATPTRDTNRD